MYICTQSTPSVSALKYVRWSYHTKSLVPLSFLLHHEPLVPCKELLYVVTGHEVLLSESYISSALANQKWRKYLNSHVAYYGNSCSARSSSIVEATEQQNITLYSMEGRSLSLFKYQLHPSGQSWGL